MQALASSNLASSAILSRDDSRALVQRPGSASAALRNPVPRVADWTLRAATTLTFTLAPWPRMRHAGAGGGDLLDYACCQDADLDVGTLGGPAQQVERLVGPHRCWAIKMPLACSITGMVSRRA